MSRRIHWPRVLGLIVFPLVCWALIIWAAWDALSSILNHF